MQHHLITSVILLAALSFYLAGLSGAGTIAFFVGAGFEAWFWGRLVIKRPPKTE